MTNEENAPLSSDEEGNSKNITLERVIEECGSFGRYQYIHFFFLTFFPMASGIISFYYVFGAAETPYQCHLPNRIDPDLNIQVSPLQCSYVINGYADKINATYPCTSWEYDRSIFGETFTEEANLICQHSIRRSFLSTGLQMGAMFIFFIGQLADTIGRRRSMQLFIAILLITSLITQSLLQYVPMSINQKFGLLLINQFVSGMDTYMVSFLLFLELTTSAYATFVGNLAVVSFAVGEIVVTGMAYVCRHWLSLKWAMTLYFLALVPYLVFVPESPHWLLTKSRYNELEKLLRQMARYNRRSESRWLPFYRYVIDKHQKQKDMNRLNKVMLSLLAKVHRFVTHLPTMHKLVVSGFVGFITCLLYFKISYNLGAMDEINPYLNIIIGAAVKAVSYIVPSLCMIRYGRKPIFIVFLLLTIVCLLLTVLTSNPSRFVIILIAQLGKFAISGALCVTYMFIPALFPTSIRGSGLGFFILCSRLGSTLAPTIDASISHNQAFVTNMYYLYAILTGVCVFADIVIT